MRPSVDVIIMHNNKIISLVKFIMSIKNISVRHVAHGVIRKKAKEKCLHPANFHVKDHANLVE